MSYRVLRKDVNLNPVITWNFDHSKFTDLCKKQYFCKKSRQAPDGASPLASMRERDTAPDGSWSRVYMCLRCSVRELFSVGCVNTRNLLEIGPIKHYNKCANIHNLMGGDRQIYFFKPLSKTGGKNVRSISDFIRTVHRLLFCPLNQR